MTAIKATLHSYKSLATRKQLQITLEVPQEFSESALKMLGVVDPGGVQWFALTRLVEPHKRLKENEPDSVVPNAAPSCDVSQGQEARRTPFKDLRRSQQAALKIREWVFREWMEYSGLFPGWAPNRLQGDPDDRLQVQTADAALKDVLGIKSKSELDTRGPAQTKWDQLLATYDFKDRVRS